MSQRSNRIRARRESITGNARAKKVAQRSPHAQPRKRRQGTRGLVWVMMRRDHLHRRVRPR